MGLLYVRLGLTSILYVVILYELHSKSVYLIKIDGREVVVKGKLFLNVLEDGTFL